MLEKVQALRNAGWKSEFLDRPYEDFNEEVLKNQIQQELRTVRLSTLSLDLKSGVQYPLPKKPFYPLEGEAVPAESEVSSERRDEASFLTHCPRTKKHSIRNRIRLNDG